MKMLFALAGMQMRRSLCASPVEYPSFRVGIGRLNRVAAKPNICKDKAGPDEGCPVCRQGLQNFGYRDVLLLRQFLTADGYIMGRRYTKVCPKLQKRVAKCIRRSRKAGLLPNFQMVDTATTDSQPDSSKSS